jgi:uncharacterized protein DUF5710
MPRIDLRVPITEKDAAQRLGARWDSQNRIWYVPEGVDTEPLRKWAPVPESPNIRAECWFLARSARQCWRCHASSSVFGIVLPEECEVLIVEEDPEDDYWEEGAGLTTLSYVRYVAPSVANRLQDMAPLYRIDYSQTIHSFYWMNHCEHCGTKLGDHDTFQECGIAFGPGGKMIQLLKLSEPFSAACGSYSMSIR